ncbi:MAG: SDR family oxidoreductase [Acidimicrobiales bacterium]
MTPRPMAGKTIVITGANAGIGKAAAGQLAALGAAVVLTARNRAKGEAALTELRAAQPEALLELVDLDLADTASIDRCAEQLLARWPRIDVLVNNAGLILDRREETAQGFEMTFGVNHLGHFLLTHRLLDRLRCSTPSRVVTVSSEAHRFAWRGLPFDDLMHTRRYSVWNAYGTSKLANISFTVELSRRLEGTGVVATCLHPGTVRTEFGQNRDLHGIVAALYAPLRSILATAERGASTTTYLASSSEVEGQSGGYYVNRRPRVPSSHARDREAASRLWEISEELLALV